MLMEEQLHLNIVLFWHALQLVLEVIDQNNHSSCLTSGETLEIKLDYNSYVSKFHILPVMTSKPGMNPYHTHRPVITYLQPPQSCRPCWGPASQMWTQMRGLMDEQAFVLTEPTGLRLQSLAQVVFFVSSLWEKTQRCHSNVYDTCFTSYLSQRLLKPCVPGAREMCLRIRLLKLTEHSVLRNT